MHVRRVEEQIIPAPLLCIKNSGAEALFHFKALTVCALLFCGVAFVRTNLDFIKIAVVTVAAVVYTVLYRTFDTHISSFCVHNNNPLLKLFKASPYEIIISRKAVIMYQRIVKISETKGTIYFAPLSRNSSRLPKPQSTPQQSTPMFLAPMTS